MLAEASVFKRDVLYVYRPRRNQLLNTPDEPRQGALRARSDCCDESDWKENAKFLAMITSVKTLVMSLVRKPTNPKKSICQSFFSFPSYSSLSVYRGI